MIVEISLDDIINCDGMDGFNNLVEARLIEQRDLDESQFLEDISYEVLGAGSNGPNPDVRIKVTANVVGGDSDDETEN